MVTGTEPVNTQTKPQSEPSVKPQTSEPSNVVTQPSQVDKDSYTREEVEKIKAEAVSKAEAAVQAAKDKELRKLKREAETASALTSRLEQLEKQIATQEAEKERLELEAANSDPQLATNVRRLQQIRKEIKDNETRKAELAAEIEEHEDVLNEIKRFNKGKEAKDLADEFGIPVDAILEVHVDTPEQMRKVAESLANALKKLKVSPENKTEDNNNPSLPRPGTPSPTTGSRSQEEQLKQMYPTMFPK